MIDSLGPGGAERQLVELAVGLRARGHEVALCHYHSQDRRNTFFEALLLEGEVDIKRFPSMNRGARILMVRKWLKHFQPDVLQTFLPGPNAVGILSGILGRSWKVVVSERRNLDYWKEDFRGYRTRATTFLYRAADWIVTNSHSARGALVELVPAFKRRSFVIWNSVDLSRFREFERKARHDPFRFLCVGSMSSVKNPGRLVEALAILRERYDKKFILKWVGRCDLSRADHRNAMEETMALIARYNLQDVFFYSGEMKRIEEAYRWADALVLVSTREGLPNVICEGMASGLPIVASAISDIPRIVRDRENGFLCDPLDPRAIAGALEECLALSDEGLGQFGVVSREMAEEYFDRNVFIGKYEALYEKLLERPVDSEAGHMESGDQSKID